MFTHYLKQISLSQIAGYALVTSAVAVLSLFATFVLAEPVISHGQSVASSTFTVRQTVTDESSFLVAPTNVAMSGSIAGTTGGNATGTTSFVVQSNNAAGYYVELAFEDNTTPNAMLGDTTGSQAIRDYDGDVAGEPSYGWTASSAAQFAYTVMSSSSADTDRSFRDNGGACDVLTSNQGNCWKSPAVAGFRIVDTSAASVSGSTSTIQFKVNVPSASSPLPTADTYTATATLSLFIK